jgi:HemY protein
MKRLFLLLLVLIAVVSGALLALRDTGYVLIRYGTLSVESSLTLAVLVIAVGFVVGYYLLRFIVGMLGLPRRLRDWRQRRQVQRARLSLQRGMIDLAEGHWEKAEKSLQKVRHSDMPLMNYLGAARAAQQLGAHERRDEYLKLAHLSMPSADIAVGLAQAELQIAHHQLEQALATLTRLHGIAPKHGYILKLLMRLYRELRDWERLRELLPELRKRGVGSNAELDETESEMHLALLEQSAQARDLSALQLTWNRIARNVREQERVLCSYARHLITLEANAAAEPLIRDALKNRWSEELVYLYGTLAGPDPARQLANAEAWLKTQGKNPVLLLTLGRLSKRNHLWGKARAYLEASLGIRPRAATYQELGGLLEQLKDKEAALQCYRKGMLLMASDAASTPAMPAPAKQTVLPRFSVT